MERPRRFISSRTIVYGFIRLFVCNNIIKLFIYAFRTTHDIYNTLNQRPTSNVKAHAAAVGTYFSTAERLHKDRFA